MLPPTGVGLTGSLSTRNALIRCSSAGVADRLRFREWTLLGDPVEGDAVRIVLVRRFSSPHSTGGDLGESTVTRGGKG
jgi:hypothetical protein